MVSRRKILSRSRDDLNMEGNADHPHIQDEEDVWYQKEKLFKVRTFHWEIMETCKLGQCEVSLWRQIYRVKLQLSLETSSPSELE